MPISKVLGLTLALALLSSVSLAQSIAGIQVGEGMNALDSLNLKPIAKERMGAMETVKYHLRNGNELSVTYESPAGNIVYVECDWNRNPKSAVSDFPGFEFGTTTLEKIRIANGSNGFSYRSHAMGTAGGELFTFNAYAVKDKPRLIAVFATTLNIADLRKRRANKEPDADDIAKNLKLDAVILADETYLNGIWGSDKIYDQNERPIVWPASEPTTAEPSPNSP